MHCNITTQKKIALKFRFTTFIDYKIYENKYMHKIDVKINIKKYKGSTYLN